MNRVWLEPQSRAALMAPPLWFVGLQEMAIGHIIADLPRRQMPPRIREAEARATRLYTGARTLFPGLALTAVVKLTAVTLSAVLLFAWNNRRMVPPPPATATAGWIRRGIGAAARVRHPPARNAGELLLHAADAAAQRAAPADDRRVARVRPDGKRVRRGGRQRHARVGDSVPMTAGVLAVQPVLLTALLIGFRHAVRVPAELAANWAVQVAWAGDTRPHIAGAKAAGALLFVVGPVLALLPFYAVVFSLADAMAIALCGLAAGAVILETLFMSYRKMPFACGYLPGESQDDPADRLCRLRVLHLPVRPHRAGGAAIGHRADVRRRARRDLPEPARHRRLPAPDTRRLRVRRNAGAAHAASRLELSASSRRSGRSGSERASPCWTV